MNISNNISSIKAHQNMMNATANNIANVNTDKFVPTDTRIENNESSVTANNRKADNPQTDLAKEIPDQMIAQKATSLNVTAIRTEDEMLGSLLDIKA